jgi:two-component system, NarL family, nitrate/nitrite response regulator NarL
MGRVLLLLSLGLLRNRLSQVLREAGFMIFEMAGGVDCPFPPPSQSGGSAHGYLITDLNNSCTKIQLLKRFVASAPQSHVVLLVENLEPDLIQRPEISLASCVLSSSISPSELLDALNWARSGERVIQRCLLTPATPPKDHGATPPRTPAHRVPPYTRLHEPSPREKEILRCLVLGYTNKMIARHLRITEATVKVHLKHLLKKICVENRTQAAIWAFNTGYVKENAGHTNNQSEQPEQARD